MKLTIQFVLLISFIPLLANNQLIAQELITHSVGDDISVEEALAYELFSDVSGFRGAKFKKTFDVRFGYLMIYDYEDEKDAYSISVQFVTSLKKLINLSLVQSDSVDSGFKIHNYQKIKLNLKSGTSLIGSFMKWRGIYITIMTEFGEQSINLDLIYELTFLESVHFKDGVYTQPDPNYTRLFFSPTGRNLKAGKGYFSDYQVVFPGVAFGISDKLTIGGGIFPFISSDFVMGWFTPKLGIVETDDYAIAVGLLSVFIGGISDTFNAGIIYGVGTWGNPDKAVTFGLGYGYVESELADKPMVMIGYEKRIGKRTKFLSENWIFPGVDDPLISLGIRWFGEKMALDFGMFRTTGMEFLGVPWVDFIVNF